MKRQRSGGFPLSEIKTYRCPSNECPFYISSRKKGNKRRKTLCKGVIDGDSFLIVKCDSCGKDLTINVEEKKSLDNKAQSVLDMLKANRADS